MSHLIPDVITPSAVQPKPAGTKSRLHWWLAAAIFVESSSLAFFSWFLIPRLEALLNALRDDEPIPQFVVYARYEFFLLALCAAVTAIWTLFKTSGKTQIWILTGLFLILLLAHGFMAYASVFSPHGGLSSSIRMD